jgi:hypothetical protein
MRTLLLAIPTVLCTSAYSEPFKDMLLSVKGQDRIALLSLLKSYDSSCRKKQSYFSDEAKTDPKVPESILSLDPKNLYEIQLTPEGKTATVLYSEFHCRNAGAGWCGSGGCSFHIISDGQIFDGRGGKPYSVTAKDTTLIIVPVHGSECVNSDGEILYGAANCSMVAEWDAKYSTFHSVNNLLRRTNF